MTKKLIKKFIHRFIPNPNELKEHKHLKIFGNIIHDPNLWHLNRYSVSTAFGVGLFAALIPVPFQMLLAAALAIMTRGNLLIAMALAWVSNPFTTPALLYLSYKIGAFILDLPPQHFHIEFTFEWLIEEFNTVGAAILLGCFISGILFGILGNIAIRLIWRFSVTMAWRKRLERLKRARRLKKVKKSRRKKKTATKESDDNKA